MKLKAGDHETYHHYYLSPWLDNPNGERKRLLARSHRVQSRRSWRGYSRCNTTKANLRERPDTTSAVIKELKQGEVLALISRTPLGPWSNVIHVRSSTEGWINGNTIRVKYTEERETGTSQDPSIKVTNDSDVTLYLKVGDDDRTVISPHATKVMVKSPGTYKFYA